LNAGGFGSCNHASSGGTIPRASGSAPCDQQDRPGTSQRSRLRRHACLRPLTSRRTRHHGRLERRTDRQNLPRKRDTATSDSDAAGLAEERQPNSSRLCVRKHQIFGSYPNRG
jgi:hypothetical protein